MPAPSKGKTAGAYFSGKWEWEAQVALRMKSERGAAMSWTPLDWTEISAAKPIKRIQLQIVLSLGNSSSNVLSLRETCQDGKGTKEMAITVRHAGTHL